MNLHRLKKKGYEFSSQEYYKEITVQYKKRKTTLPNITSLDMMEVCEVRYECPYEKSPTVMENCVNENLDDISRKYLKEMNNIGVHEDAREKNYQK